MLTQLARVQVLLETKRYGDAQALLREMLAANPNNAPTHALLSYALYLQDRNAGALREAQAAIRLDPNDPSNHYYQALALLALERAGSAMSAIQEAIRLDPQKAHYHAVVSRIYVKRKAWQKALAAAEKGLRFDPENTPCLNLRGMALVNLGRVQEAAQTLATALARDPENALTHANQGWALMHAGAHGAALTHFREALRLDPMLDWARSGIVEALKARNPAYRLVLRYFLWMSRLTTQEQWETIAIVSSIWRAVRTIARTVPVLYLLLWPFSLLWFFFSVLTWTARPLFALTLRLDRLGRLALPREEVVASNWVAACLLTAGAGLVLGLVFWNPAFLVLVGAGLAMILPVAGVFRCDPGIGRIILIVYSVLLAVVGLVAFALTLVGSWAIALAGVSGIAFLIGWTSYTWIASLIVILTRAQTP